MGQSPITFREPIPGVATARFGFQPLFVSQATAAKIIVVHPHAAFDGAYACREYLSTVVAGHAHIPDAVLTLQGLKIDPTTREFTDQRLPCYYRNFAHARVTCSRDGTIAEQDLERFCDKSAVIVLAGGIVTEYHLWAFISLLEYVKAHSITDLEVIVPFDGCYFQHGWVEWAIGDEWKYSKKLSGRFDGICLGPDIYAMSGADSYSLRNVVYRTFRQAGTDGLEADRHLQVCDADGRPVVATRDIFLKNVATFFDVYLYNAARLGIGVQAQVTSDQLSFLLAPSGS